MLSHYSFKCRDSHNELYNISYLWYSSLAVIVGVTVAIIVSLITGKSSFLSQRYLSPESEMNIVPRE